MKWGFIIITVLFIGILVLSGCDPGGVSGKDRINTPPVVQFVNIPVEAAKFSSDTTIYWYGTDVDGFITSFQYSVVVDSIVGNPEVFIDTASDATFRWTVLNVELDDPQTNEKVKMSADIKDPVRKYVSSYVFLQAIDNLGAKSKIVYRMFLKNNHFPNTLITSRNLTDPYVNTASRVGVLEGIRIGWSGEDPIDYPRNPPAFEFQWRFYGPYTDSEMVFINDSANHIIERVFLDLYGDIYHVGGSYPVIGGADTIIDSSAVPPETTITVDTTFIPVDTVHLAIGNPYGTFQNYFYLDSIPDSLNTLIDSSLNVDGSPWIFDQNVSIFDAYRNHQVDTTSQYNFVIWCQARDDSKVPDPIPGFSWVSVIEPKFERAAIVIDVASYKSSNSGFWNWPIFPFSPYPKSTIPLVKKVIGEMVNSWMGDDNAFDIYDTLSEVVHQVSQGRTCRIEYGKYHATQDYYPIQMITKCESFGIQAVNLRDILKHKIIILIKDDVGIGKLKMASPILLSVLDGLNAGMSCWAMLRSPFMDFADPTFGGTWQDVPISYTQYFGVVNMRYQGWHAAINQYDFGNPGIRVEDFVAAEVLPQFADSFPSLVVDTSLLENRYLWLPGPAGINEYDFRCNENGQILVGALPEVGYVQKSLFAEAMYLFVSKYGNAPISFTRICSRDVGHWWKSHGTVVGIRYNTGLFRTAHLSFSLLPFDSTTAQTVFNSMMDWLAVQPYIQTGKLAPGAPAKLNVAALRNISNELHELKKQGLLERTSDD